MMFFVNDTGDFLYLIEETGDMNELFFTNSSMLLLVIWYKSEIDMNILSLRNLD